MPAFLQLQVRQKTVPMFCLLKRLGLGGEMLSGMTIDGAVNARGERIVGILDELIEELKLMDGYVGIFNDWRLIRYICIDPVVMQMAVMKVLSKYGVEILLHSVMEDVIVRDGTGRENCYL